MLAVGLVARIETLEDIAVFAMLGQPALFGDKPLNFLKTGDNPLYFG
jgi:hypothetical protein